MRFSTRLCTTAALLLAAFSVSATQELKGRDASFNAVVDATAANVVYLYDPVFDITWLREVGTQALSWTAAKNWAESAWGGLSGWRLPTLVDKGKDGCNYLSIQAPTPNPTDCGYYSDTSKANGSEIAHLYYDVLGNTRQGGLTNTGDFVNLSRGGYWTDVSYILDSTKAWYFITSDGFQYFGDKAGGFSGGFKALAVRDGDVLAAAVPEPETTALLLAGLGMLAWRQRRRPSN